MSLIQTPWTSQPQQAVGIDWSNPITRGLVYCKNLALETGFTKVGTKIVASQHGSTLGFGATFGVGSTDSVETTLTTSSTARTILVVYNRNGTGGGAGGRVFDKRTVSGQVEEMQNGGVGMLYGGSWTGGTGLFSWPAQPFGTPVNCVISYDKSSTSNVPLVAENGVRLSVTTTSAPSGSVITNTDPYVIGNRKNDNARNWDGTIALFAVFDRALSEQEAKSLSQNPWQIFKPLPRRIFAPVATGGGTTAVTSDHNASYTIIGSVAADASAAYAIRAAVTADAAASYALRAAAQADQAAAYAIRAAVASDLAGSYAIQTSGTVTTGLDAAYAVRGSVAGDISVGYQIAAAVQAEVAAAYAVRVAVQKDLAAGYSVSDSVTNVSADIVCTYAINGVSPSYPSAESIAAAILAALNATTIPVDVQKMNGAEVIGDGSVADPWRGVGVPV